MKIEIFSTEFQEIFKFQISRKSVQWEPSCSVRTDGQTHVTNLLVVLRNSAKTHTMTMMTEQNLAPWFATGKSPAQYFGLQT